MQTIMAKEQFDATQKAFPINVIQSIQFISTAQNKQGTLLQKENLLLFVLKGTMNIRLGKDHRNICKGDLAFLSKDTLIEYIAEPNTPEVSTSEFILISFSTNLVKEFAKIATLPVYTCDEREPLVICRMDAGLQKYLDFLQIYFWQTEKIEVGLVKIKLLELLFYLSRYYLNILVLILDVKESYRNYVTQAVEENILNSVSMSQLAGLSGRSLSSFRRDFLAVYKMPPSQWMRQKRLDKAKELLQSTNMTITDICYTTGFENIAHFSRLFKSRFNQPPSAFRQNSYSLVS